MTNYMTHYMTQNLTNDSETQVQLSYDHLVLTTVLPAIDALLDTLHDTKHDTLLTKGSHSKTNTLIFGFCQNGLDPPPLFSWTPTRHLFLDEKSAGKQMVILS